MNTPTPTRRALLRQLTAATIATTLNIGTVAHAALPPGAVTQLPDRPDLHVSWLKSIHLSRPLVQVGEQITGTIVLKRPAVSNMQISVSLEGARNEEAGVQVANGATLFGSLVTVRRGDNQATFRIDTFTPWDTSRAPRPFAVTVRLDPEALRTGFTVLYVPLESPSKRPNTLPQPSRP